MTPRWLAHSRSRWADRFAATLLGVFFVVESAGQVLRSGRFDAETLGDFAINRSFAMRLFERSHFPDDFYYPLPFALLTHGLGRLGELGAGLWLGLLVAAAWACAALSIELVAWRARPGRWVLVLLACTASVYFVQWDLRAANVNLLALCCVLGALVCAQRRRSAVAGLLLAASVSLKLYSGVLLPYLAWRGELRWLLWTGVALVLFFLGVPCLLLGPGPALALSGEWITKLVQLPEPAALPHYYVSLERSALAALTQAVEPARQGPAFDPRWVSAGVRLAQLAFATLVAATVWRARRLEPRRGELVAVSALLLLPLPLSPTFQPHHAVLLWLPALLLSSVVFDEEFQRLRRVIAGSFLVGLAGVVKLVPEWPERAVAIHAAVLLGALSLHWVSGITRQPAAEGRSQG